MMQQCVKTRPPLAAVLAEVLHPHLMRQWLATLPEDTVFYWSSGARDGYESVTEYIRYAAPEIDEIMLLMALRDAAFPGSPPVIVLTWRSLVDADTRPIHDYVNAPRWVGELAQATWDATPTSYNSHKGLSPAQCAWIIESAWLSEQLAREVGM